MAEALQSVQRQDLPTKVILCVASDNSWIGDILARTRVQVHLLRLPLASPGRIRNEAIGAVTTEFVAFLDGDDLWQPNKLSRQITILLRGNFDVVASKHILIREDGTPFFYGFAKSIPMTSSWLGRTVVFRAKNFEDVYVGEDVQLWRRLTSEVRSTVASEYLLLYRVREISLSEATASKRRKLAYSHLSRTVGMRQLLLAASYTVNVALDLRVRLRPGAGASRHAAASPN